MTEKTCKELVDQEFESTTDILKKLFSDWRNDKQDHLDEWGRLEDFGLCFDRTEDQDGKDYYRYQLSWGGPEEEIRFYATEDKHSAYHIEYWYKNWFDGACIEIGPMHKDRPFYQEMWYQYFSELA